MPVEQIQCGDFTAVIDWAGRVPMKHLDIADIRGGVNDPVLSACARAVALDRPLCLLGPPGTGKTMIARRVSLIMDPLADHERRWLDAEYEGMGMLPRGGVTERPFRAPHHTISTAALTGTALPPRTAGCPICVKAGKVQMHEWHTLPAMPVRRAGELQLARFGVLMLDEIQEFSLAAIESLTHAMRTMHGRPLVIATASSCPCGWRGCAVRQCACTPDMIARYGARLTLTLRTLGIEDTMPVAPVSLHDMQNKPSAWTTATLRAHVEELRQAGAP